MNGSLPDPTGPSGPAPLGVPSGIQQAGYPPAPQPERVLCIRTADFLAYSHDKHWERFPNTTSRIMRFPDELSPPDVLLPPELHEVLTLDTFFIDREDAEKDAGYLQIIPYCTFLHTTKKLIPTTHLPVLDGPGHTMVYMYTRMKTQGEVRLHGKNSIGIGGHINPVDTCNYAPDTFARAWDREVQEEVHVQTVQKAACIGIIYDSDQKSQKPGYPPVGSVHLGVSILHFCQLPSISPKEESMGNPHFRALSDLATPAEYAKLEYWSQAVVSHLHILGFGSAPRVNYLDAPHLMPDQERNPSQR